MLKRKILIAVLLLVLIGGGYALYMWNKPRRDVRDETGIQVTATAIFDAYTKNEQAANQLYLNKAIQVTGVVDDVKKNESGQTVVYLKTSDPMFGVNCTFKESPGELAKDAEITFKGICTGFTNDVIIGEGVLVKK